MTRTLYNTSQASKLTFSMFFNTAIQNFMIKVMIPWNLGTFDDAKDSIIKAGGLVTN